jgi:hypothetical protein
MQIAPHLARNQVATFTMHEPLNLTGKSGMQDLMQTQILVKATQFYYGCINWLDCGDNSM